MDRSKLIWGFIFLAIAGALVVANLRLPPEDLSFQIGDRNMPWVPPIVLAVIGIILIAAAYRSTEGQKAEEEIVVDPDKAALNKRLETMAVGAFLVMLGGMALIPEEQLNEGWWSVGVGLVLLGLNAARYFRGLRMSGFTTALGIIALVTGAGELAGVDLPGLAILLILLGAYVLLKPWFERRRLFGKAEET
jgi:hypothetical protein